MVSLFIAWLGMFLRVRAYVLSLFVRLTVAAFVWHLPLCLSE